MHFELTIKGDSFEEISAIFARNTSAPGYLGDGRYPDHRSKEVEPEEEATGKVEAESEAPAPKPTRTRRGAAKQDTPPSTTQENGTGPSATTAPPSDEKVTFEDIRALASSLMDSGKVDAKAIQNMLVDKFDARAFGAVKEEDYAACLAELQNLGE